MSNETRKFTTDDIREIRRLLFGRRGRGSFEVRSSPEDDGTTHGGDHTCDARNWNKADKSYPLHDDLDFPVACDKTAKRDRKDWPQVYEGIEFDLYCWEPVEWHDRQEDWQMGNYAVVLRDGAWSILH